MKQTSITKLSEVYNALLNNPDNKRLADLIQQVIRAETMTDAKKGKFDYFNYVENSKFVRPIMQCVFHDEGFKVASDSYILIAIKDNYPEEFEHKMLHADGSFEEYGTYPKWRSVIPNPDGYQPYTFDAQKFYGWLTERRAARKAETGKGCRFSDSWAVKVGPCYLKAESFDKLLTAMERIGATELMARDDRRAVYAKTEAGLVLLMPVAKTTQEALVLA